MTECEPRVRRIYLLVPEFSAIDGVAEQIATLAIEFAHRGVATHVFIRRPCTSDNQYLRRLRESCVFLTYPPRVLAFLGNIDWTERDQILQTVIRLVTPLLVLPAAVDALLRHRAFHRSLRGAKGYLNRVLGRVFLPDYLDRIFHMQLAWHVWRNRPEIVEISRSDYVWQVDWFWRRNIPVVYREHGMTLYRTPEQLRSLRRATCCIAVSDSAGNALRTAARPNQDVFVVPNAVDVSHLDLTGKSLQQFKAGNPVLVALVTRLSPEKGVQYLPEIARLVIDEFADVCFLVAGDGPLRNEVAQACVSLAIDDRVRLLGVLDHDQVLELLSRSDIFLLPSLTEGMPVSVIEAMACGTPVVTTAVGGTPELITDGVSGILVQPADPDTLAQAVIKLLLDVELRMQLGNAGRKAYENGPWTPKSAVDSTLSVYEHAMQIGQTKQFAQVKISA